MWRGIGIRGGLDNDHYQLSIIDPEIENWVNSYSRDIPERWWPQKNFGFNLQRQMVRNKDKLLEDIRVFAQQLWKAFYLDFLRIKLLKYCR